jgi:hypothetical protein
MSARVNVRRGAGAHADWNASGVTLVLSAAPVLADAKFGR